MAGNTCEHQSTYFKAYGFRNAELLKDGSKDALSIFIHRNHQERGNRLCRQKDLFTRQFHCLNSKDWNF